MIFEKGKCHIGHYETPYGDFTISVTANDINVSLDENGGIGVGPCSDMVLHENLLFTIGGGRLTCVDIGDIENPKILSYLAIDAPLRQIALHPDGNHVIIINFLDVG